MIHRYKTGRSNTKTAPQAYAVLVPFCNNLLTGQHRSKSMIFYRRLFYFENICSIMRVENQNGGFYGMDLDRKKALSYSVTEELLYVLARNSEEYARQVLTYAVCLEHSCYTGKKMNKTKKRPGTIPRPFLPCICSSFRNFCNTAFSFSSNFQ